MAMHEFNPRLELYILYNAVIAFVIIAPLMPLTLLVAIGAAFRRKKAVGTMYESHFIWLMRTITITVVAVMLLALPLWGFPTLKLLLAPVVWGLYRIIKGEIWLYQNKAIANPKAWF